MFPYFEQPVLRIGPLALHAFGALVASGFLLGLWMTIRRAQQKGLDGTLARGLVVWMVGAGFVVSHLTHVVFSNPGALRENPLLLLNLWAGISSFGGLIGAIPAGLWFLKRRGLSRSQLWAYLDVLAFVFPFAWVLGRAGCSVAHDHPGIHTASWLAVRYPDGPRYDLGLLEFFYSLLLAGLFLALDRRRWPTGFYFGLFFLLYGPVRFLLDTLRVDEVRHFGLTSGQYGSIVATLVGLATLAILARRAARRDALQ